MKKRALFVSLLLTLPAFAAITNVQSSAAWSCSGTGSSIVCSVTLTTQATATNNLLAVWTFWQSGSTYTASVQDSQLNGVNGFFPGAVGPTLQSASNTSGQIFYAAKITGSGLGRDMVTVTFTCVSATLPLTCATSTITDAGVVAVEYSGADIYYPLDSASAGFSTTGNPTALLDSGDVSPANSNLVLFAGGVTDATTGLTAGSSFTGLQFAHGSSGSSVAEQMIVSGNNTLQRATACLGGACPPPNGTTPGNWLMQMA